MTHRLRITLAAMVTAGICFAQPGVEWHQMYLWEGHHGKFWDIYLTGNGDLACCGIIGNYVEDNQLISNKSWLLRANSGGEQIFNRRFFEPENNHTLQSLIETNDGGFFAGGHNNWARYQTLVLAIMTDGDGDEIWQRTIAVDDNEESFCSAVIESKGGQYIMAGGTRPNPNSLNTDAYALALDSEGNLEWEQVYHEDHATTYVYDIREVNDGYMLGGRILRSEGTRDFWLQKIDEDGEIVWANEYGSPEIYEYCNSMTSCNDGGWILAGSADQLPILMRVGQDGDLMWTANYDGNEDYYYRIMSVVQSEDGNFYIVGYVETTEDYRAQGLVIAADAQGEELWRRVDDLDYDDVYYSSAILSEGDALIATGNANISEEDIYQGGGLIVKFAPDRQRPEIREYLPRETRLKALPGDSIRFAVRAVDYQDDELEYSWTLDGDVIGDDTTTTVVLEELDVFEVKCVVSDGEDSDSVRWSVDVVDLYIASYNPDSLELVIRRGDMLDFSVIVRATEGDPVEYVWRFDGDQVGENDSIAIDFELAGQVYVDVLAYRGNSFSDVTWSVQAVAAVWDWWPRVDTLSWPVDTIAAFFVWPFNPQSDSLSYLWELDGDSVGADTSVGIEFSEVRDYRLTAYIRDGSEADTLNWEITIFDPFGVGEFELTPSTFTLHLPRPNPFNGSTTLTFTLPRQENVKLKVYDLSGREVAVVYEGIQEAGTQTVTWDASGMASGIYYARLESAGRTATTKLVLVR